MWRSCTLASRRKQSHFRRFLMTFHSILLDEPDGEAQIETNESPQCFVDLNLDQVFAAITTDWKDYNLSPFYNTPLKNIQTIQYRHDVIRDLEIDGLLECISAFSAQMRAMRVRLEEAKHIYYKRAAQREFLGAVQLYCEAIHDLSRCLCTFHLGSKGLLTFREYVKAYVLSSDFLSLSSEVSMLRVELSAIRYCLVIKGNGVSVRNYEEEDNYSTAVEQTFEKFRRDTTDNYWVKTDDRASVNHVQSEVLDRLALLNPETFRALEAFSNVRADYVDKTLIRFDREVQFYLAYLKYIQRFRRAGLLFCRPRVSQTSKEERGGEAFDLALAGKLIDQQTPVVCNDFYLGGAERILVVSGPNQGGKTTFARMFGQLHYLASLGLPVPGTEAQVFLCDGLFTHFDGKEDLTSLRGKLQDDLVRIKHILDQATPDSLIIMNEIFASTTLKDAIYLSKKIVGRISALDLLCVCVTFLDELASFNEKTVSVASTVDPGNPAIRTYKIVRKPADGLAYALAIARKYRLTYNAIKERIAS